MTKYQDDFSGITYDTEEECQEVVCERLDEMDVEDALGRECTLYEIMCELRRLDSPLYDRAVATALGELYDDYITEVEVDEEEDDPFHENDPYVVTNPMAFY